MPGDALLTLQKVQVQCDMQNALQSSSVYGASQVQLITSKLAALSPSANEKARNLEEKSNACKAILHKTLLEVQFANELNERVIIFLLFLFSTIIHLLFC